MNYKDDFNVFVGGKSGIFKGLKVKQDSCVMKNIQNLVSITDNHEVTCMSWGDDDEKEVLVACGSKDVRSVKSYDTENHSFKTSFICHVGKGNIVGIGRFNKNILACPESGQVTVWQNKEQCTIVDAGENVKCMRQAKGKRNIVATGGLENPLKLWDLEKQKNIFIHKNVPNDWLQLRVPIGINDICFTNDHTEVVTVSRHGFIYYYDTKVQRRPVLKMESKEECLTTIAESNTSRQVVFGSGRGRMAMADLRKPGKIVHVYKGPVGAITSVAVSKTDSCIVSVSLDRHLYVHDLNKTALLKKVYLTSKLSDLVIRSEFSLKKVKEEQEDEVVDVSDNDFEGSGEEYSNDDSDDDDKDENDSNES